MPAVKIYGNTGHMITKVMTDYPVAGNAHIVPMNSGMDLGLITADLPRKAFQWCLLGARVKDYGKVYPCCLSVCFMVVCRIRVTIGMYPEVRSKFGWHRSVIKIERIK